MKEIGAGEVKPLSATRDAVRIVRGVLQGTDFSYEGKTFTAIVPPLAATADSPHESVPIYVAGTGPRMQQYAGEEADGLLTPSITTPAFVRYSRENLREGAARTGRDPDRIDLGCTVVASIDEDRDRGRDGAREIAGMYLANKVQNIQASADTLLELAGLSQDEIRPIAEAMESGGRLAAAAAVTDEILDKARPIAGTPDDCIEAIEAYWEAGCTHIMLELWGDARERQIELFADKVLPHFAGAREGVGTAA
jgi:alkanesulfonate monooxygenase SsuD/methylene tetrahydromethanopterin reductase-like flavin-dependent oxidoreductase (luciferase family)